MSNKLPKFVEIRYTLKAGGGMDEIIKNTLEEKGLNPTEDELSLFLSEATDVYFREYHYVLDWNRSAILDGKPTRAIEFSNLSKGHFLEEDE